VVAGPERVSAAAPLGAAGVGLEGEASGREWQRLRRGGEDGTTRRRQEELEEKTPQ